LNVSQTLRAFQDRTPPDRFASVWDGRSPLPSPLCGFGEPCALRPRLHHCLHLWGRAPPMCIYPLRGSEPNNPPPAAAGTRKGVGGGLCPRHGPATSSRERSVSITHRCTTCTVSLGPNEVLQRPPSLQMGPSRHRVAAPPPLAPSPRQAGRSGSPEVQLRTGATYRAWRRSCEDGRCKVRWGPGARKQGGSRGLRRRRLYQPLRPRPKPRPPTPTSHAPWPGLGFRELGVSLAALLSSAAVSSHPLLFPPSLSSLKCRPHGLPKHGWDCVRIV
jgi:hypothetical protein